MKYICTVLLFLIYSACNQVKKITSALPGASISYHPLQTEKDLDILIKEIGSAKLVLLGEESHGTHEYYLWRASITKRLIQEKGFTLVAMEGDWEDFQNLNNLIKGQGQDSNAIAAALGEFHRWPEWIWNNYETISTINWLNNYNQNKTEQLNLFGLDLYSFWSWSDKITSIRDTLTQQAARQLNHCFTSYDQDAMNYAKAVEKGKANCSEITERFFNLVREKRAGAKVSFDLQQHALLSLYGENFFRTLAHNKGEARDIRERYMAETIKALLHQYGSKAKMIIWVHNTHAGDTRFIDRSTPGYTSLGEILKKETGSDNVYSVGFGTYKGSVIASYNWNDPPREIKMLPAKQGSWEDLLHQLGAHDKSLISKEMKNNPVSGQWIEFRSVGVVNEEWTIYNRSIMPRRFDAFIFIDSTSALHLTKKY